MNRSYGGTRRLALARLTLLGLAFLVLAGTDEAHATCTIDRFYGELAAGVDMDIGERTSLSLVSQGSENA